MNDTTAIQIALTAIASALGFLGIQYQLGSSKASVFVAFIVSVLLFLAVPVVDSVTGVTLDSFLRENVGDPFARIIGLTPATREEDRKQSAAGNNRQTVPAPKKNMWSIVKSPTQDDAYTSDLLLTQTEIQLGFSCLPYSLNIFVVLLNGTRSYEEFKDFFGSDVGSISASYVFYDSGRHYVLEFLQHNHHDNEDLVFGIDVSNFDAFSIENAEEIVKRGLVNENDFSISFEKNGRSWQTGVYPMEDAGEAWEEANQGRSGPARSRSAICNSYANR